ncbi:MAG: ABC transporter permease [Acidobacteriota bacterium]
MGRYVIRRLVVGAVVLTGVLLLTFLLIHCMPGDPVRSMLGDAAQSADVVALRHRLGLDLPIAEQLRRYLLNIARLDLGRSVYSSQPVMMLVSRSFRYTLVLALAALSIGTLSGVPLGAFAALKDRGWGSAISAAASAAWAVPVFWLAPMLTLGLAVKLGLLPVSGCETAVHMVLPALTLAVPTAAYLTRMTKARVEAVVVCDFVRALRARGLRESRVVALHVLPNALVPLLSVVALLFGNLLAGAVITESVFAWPGMGRLLVTSIAHRDYPVIQACVLVAACLYVGLNLAADLLHAALDPRVREGLD